tara:strand:+ start:2181 stop:2501 length:321 start_codon:yes stop_codon:yes gene_type:complete
MKASLTRTFYGELIYDRLEMYLDGEFDAEATVYEEPATRESPRIKSYTLDPQSVGFGGNMLIRTGQHHEIEVEIDEHGANALELLLMFGYDPYSEDMWKEYEDCLY